VTATADTPMPFFALVLLFRGFQVDPDVISLALHLTPDHVARIGERTILKHGTVLGFPSRINTWLYQEEYTGESNFSSRLSQLVERLLLATNFLTDLNKECERGAGGCLSVQLPGDVHSGSIILPSTLGHIVTLGLRFGVEVFPCWNR